MFVFAQFQGCAEIAMCVVIPEDLECQGIALLTDCHVQIDVETDFFERYEEKS